MNVRIGPVLSLSAVIVLGPTVFAQSIPSVGSPTGERLLGRTVIEPAYDDRTGTLVYLSTPIGAPFPSKANHHAVSPLYLVVYPDSAAESVGLMNCMHEGGDNCADHGPGVADAAASIMPSVYGGGVWGHDHLVDGPGGSDFNIAWQVVIVLFTNAEAANTHVTTDAQVEELVKSGDAILIPDVTFNCSVVSAATYARATPLPPA